MKILIAGAGIRGKRIAELLSIYDLQIEAFIDNDNKKWNTEIEKGITCYSIDFFADREEEYVIIVSPQNGEELWQSLKKIYSNVLSLKITEMVLQSAYNIGYEKFFPIGHFYSLYPKIEDVLEKPDYAEIDQIQKIEGVNLCEELQREYLEKMMNLYQIIPQWKRGG